MRDKRTPKDVCGEVRFVLRLVNALFVSCLQILVSATRLCFAFVSFQTEKKNKKEGKDNKNTR